MHAGGGGADARESPVADGMGVRRSRTRAGGRRPFGMTPWVTPQRFGRTLGALLAGGGLLTVLRIVISGAIGTTAATGAVAVVATVAGVASFLAAGHLSPRQLIGLCVLATLLVAAGVALRPVPYGAGYMYVWFAPFAYVAGRRVGLAMVGLAGVSLAVAFAVQATRVPDPLGVGEYVSWWLAAITSVAVVGAVTRTLAGLVTDARERLHRSFEQGVLGMAFLDAEGRWERVNPALAGLMGRSAEQLQGLDPRAITHPDDVGISAGWRLRALEGEAVTFEKRYLRPGGDVRWAMVRATQLLDRRGAATGFFAEYEDVTARVAGRRREAALAALGQQALAAEAIGELLDETARLVAETLEVPYATLLDADGVQVLAAAGWDGTAARGHAAAVLDGLGAIVLDDARAGTAFDASALVEAGVATGAAICVRGELEGPFAVLSAHAACDGRRFTDEDVAFLGSAANVLTAALRREAAERELRDRSLHDPLTRLPNRALLADRLRLALPRARREGRSIAVLFVDLDDFKEVNDRHGHEGGDALLGIMAPRLHGALRANDTLARFGADEFVALCEGLEDPEEALAIADRLLAAAAAPVTLGGAELRRTASIGIVLAEPHDGQDPEGLLRDADLAMHRAKTAGKGRYELFDHAMRAVALQRVALTNDLDRALERDELFLAFQPIVDLADGRIDAVEGLVRWRHPERGLIMPDEFIGLAERTGRIVQLGRWVLREAARHAAQWPELTVGVNVSRLQLTDPGIVDDVAAALADHGVAPARMAVEVTETALMDDPARAAEALHALRALGVRIALDDFGTGYSSLSSVSEFPLHTIKLDRAFLPAQRPDRQRWSIVRAVLDMARSLGLEVVAEGIETAEQHDELVRLGCGRGQGYLFSRPIGADELRSLLARAQPLA
jgi:diguanylate cyclase (GGDEF)-like protein/PAS domain S-box-containing protein